MTFGRFRVSLVNHGFYRLDGGAMFGTVPRTIWSGLIPPDEDNCIRLATRSLLIDAGDRVFIVDIGCGEKWTAKLRTIYGIRNIPPAQAGFNPDGLTDIIVSHLHFDHGGGISRYGVGGPADLQLCFPRARVHVQADNYETARNPNPRERASYMKDDVRALERTDLRLARGSEEIFPGIWVHQNDGHTRGQQWLEVKNETESIVFPADLVPTSRHLPLPYSMAFDISTETLLGEKDFFLSQAVAKRWVVVFCHDPDVPAALVRLDEKGRYALGDVVAF
jgi:glyoxylase-like metal-dependent hydrolase (beta-lactamase superfamily II)